MSQMSGVAGDGFAVNSQKAASSGRAVLLLALAVVISVMLLHSLDNAPAAGTAADIAPAANQAAAPPPPAPIAAPAVPLRAPSEVKVLVANGVGVSGAAAEVAGRIQPIGYQLATPGNTTTPRPMSVIQYAPGYQPEAQALATSLGLAATAVQPLSTPAPIADLQGSNLVVVLGNELVNQQGAAQAQTETGAGGVQQPPANPALDGPLTNPGANTPTGQNQPPVAPQPPPAG